MRVKRRISESKIHNRTTKVASGPGTKFWKNLKSSNLLQ